MSIAPPSDIILDVAQAADPARRAAAVNRLAQAAVQGGSPPVDFDQALASATPRVVKVTAAPLPVSPLTGAGRSQTPAPHVSVYQKFEAMVLQSFVAEILPKDTSLYGDAASADLSRSMLAEKLADQLAKSGRIGIARSIEEGERHAPSAMVQPPQG